MLVVNSLPQLYHVNENGQLVGFDCVSHSWFFILGYFELEVYPDSEVWEIIDWIDTP